MSPSSMHFLIYHKPPSEIQKEAITRISKERNIKLSDKQLTRLSYMHKSIVMTRLAKIEVHNRQSDAAIKVQSMFRGHLARKWVTNFKKKKLKAILIVQKLIRAFLVRKDQRLLLTLKS